MNVYVYCTCIVYVRKLGGAISEITSGITSDIICFDLRSATLDIISDMYELALQRSLSSDFRSNVRSLISEIAPPSFRIYVICLDLQER